MTTTLRGVLAFPVTPMTDNGDEIDVPTYQRLIDWQVESGVHGLIPLGSTGEFAYLTSRERKLIVDATVETVGGRVPTVIGVSAVDTKHAAEYAHEAKKAQVDAVMLSIPTYYALTTREVSRHIEAVAAAAELPIVLYNNPYTSKVDITPDFLDALLELDSIVAIKEASMDVNRIATLRRRFGDRLDILGGGFDPYALPSLCLGASGWTTALTNLAPAKCLELYNAAVVASDLKRAQELHYDLLPLPELLVELRLSVAVKAGLRLIGRPAGSPRKPLLNPSAADEERLREALAHLGVGAEAAA